VDTWYSGEDAMRKTCPICRAERGCNETMVLRGLSEFMEATRIMEATRNTYRHEESMEAAQDLQED